MIEAFEVGVALTLETDDARSALSAMAQQLSTLNQDLAQFQNTMQATPGGLGRLEVPASTKIAQTTDNSGQRGLGDDFVGPSAMSQQQSLQSVANAADYLSTSWRAGSARQSTTDAVDGSTSETGLSLPSPLGLEQLSASDNADQYSAAHPVSAVLPYAMGTHEPGGRTDVLGQSNRDLNQANVVEMPRASILGAMIDSGIAEIQGLITSGQSDTANALSIATVRDGRQQDDRNKEMPEDKASASFDSATAPLSHFAAETVGATSIPENLATLPDTAGLNELGNHTMYDVASTNSNATAAFPALPYEGVSSDASGADRPLIQSGLFDTVPPTFPQPKDTLQASSGELPSEAPNQAKQAGSQDDDDSDSFAKPIVIHTNLHLDGDVVARVVSERMIAWMNGPLSGTGGFDPRRSYTPVES